MAGAFALAAGVSNAERRDDPVRSCPVNAEPVAGDCVVVVRHGATLWRISRSLAPELGVAPAKIAAALHRLNPEAFIHGQAHRLKAGAMLRVPSTSDLVPDGSAAQTILQPSPPQQDPHQLSSPVNSGAGSITSDSNPVHRESPGELETPFSNTETKSLDLAPADSPPPLQSGARDELADNRTARRAGVRDSALWFAAAVVLVGGVSLIGCRWRRSKSARSAIIASRQDHSAESSVPEHWPVVPLSLIPSSVRFGRVLNSLAAKFLPEALHRRLTSSDLAKRLARGSLWSLSGSATSRLLVLVAMILVARELGQVRFGEFGLIQATLGVVGLMAGLGLGATATRFVAMYAASDPPRAGRVIALVSAASVGTVLLATLVLLAASGVIARSVLHAPHLQTALIWGVLLMVATTFRGVQRGVLAGLERFDSIAKLDVLDGAISLVAMLALSRYLGLHGALLGLAISAGAVWLVGFVNLRSALRHRRVVISYRGCWAERNILIGYGLPSVLSNIASTPVLWFAMTFTARSEHGYAGLGLYNAAYQWHGPIMFIPVILTSVSIPVLVQEWEAGRTDRFRKVTFSLCGLTLGIALPPVIFASLVSPWIMSLYGPGFREGWMILVLLLAAAPLNALAKISAGALLGMNRAWSVLWANLVFSAVLLTVSLWLVPAYGATGLAVALLTAYSVLGTLSFGLVLTTSGQRIGFGILPNRAHGP